MERLREKALVSVGRASAFASLGIFCVMIGLSFDPVLMTRAAQETFLAWGGEAVSDDLENVIGYFERGGVLQLGDTNSDDATLQGFQTVPGLVDVVRELALGRVDSPGHTVAGCELVLEALVGERRITRSETGRYGRAPRRTPPGGTKPPTFEV